MVEACVVIRQEPCPWMIGSQWKMSCRLNTLSLPPPPRDEILDWSSKSKDHLPADEEAYKHCTTWAARDAVQLACAAVAPIRAIILYHIPSVPPRPTWAPNAAIDNRRSGRNDLTESFRVYFDVGCCFAAKLCNPPYSRLTVCVAAHALTGYGVEILAAQGIRCLNPDA